MTSENTGSVQTTSEDRRRRRRALLAGGLVLGLGATATLASFTDDEFAFGLFNTAKFNIEGSTDGAAYNDSPIADGDQLTFQLTSTNMSPGQTVYAPYWIRTDGQTTLDGNLTHNSVSATGTLAPYLTYRMASNAATCDATATFDWVSTETPVTTASPTTTPVTLDHVGGGTPGTATQVCIAVTMSTDEAAIRNLDTTAPTTVVWGWNATSIDA